MSAPQLELRYPLQWPIARPRTADRAPALFRNDGRRLTWTPARQRLIGEVEAMTKRGKSWRVTAMVLSCNIRFTLAGTRDQNVSRREPADPGVAFYFDLDGRAHVLACDRWDTVYDNIAAIAAHIEALRGQERWGVADLAQAFAGHLALPAPGAGAPLRWRKTLGFEPADRPTRAEIDAAWRTLARTRHPDRCGTRAEWDALTAAYEAAKVEVPA